MQYGHVYVAKVAFGAKDAQTLNALREAEAYPGPALIIAYSHCIAHGFPLHLGLEQQKLAVETGYWPLFRYDPRLAANGEVPLKLDSAAPKGDVAKFMANETRFGILRHVAPERASQLTDQAQRHVRQHYALYQQLATPPSANGHAPAATPPKPHPSSPP